ncbi:hypothetical protein FKK32_28925 [Klebsiella pneumoniae]|nr:hypothetical protein [Klebsiella pneumoniae]
MSDSIAKAAAQNGHKGDLDVLDLLKKAGKTESAKHVLSGHLVLAITADMLHFLYEGFSCLEKRKFAVAFSLLRRPFKENVLFLAWLLGDPEDFLTRFEKDGNPPEIHRSEKQSYAAMASRCFGVMPPKAMFGRSWL